ncbi:MAG: DUF7446 family protein [Aeromonas sp.]
MKQPARLQLGFSPLSKKIMLAKMSDDGFGRRVRVGKDVGRDVTDEAAQLVYRLVMAKGGEISWKLEDGSVIWLKAGLTGGDK